MGEEKRKRTPLSERSALRQHAAQHLRELARKMEPPPNFLPISPEFERAMISVIAQGEVLSDIVGWQRMYQRRQELVGALLSHQYLSRETLRWITLDPTHFWRSGIARQLALHPACTILEAVVAQRAGWAHQDKPDLDGILDERWEGRAGWAVAAGLWKAWGAEDVKTFYRFADEVQGEAPKVQEVFVRLAADTTSEHPGTAERRQAWELLRIAQHI